MKRLTIILLMIGMLSLVSAGIIASTWEKDFTLDKTKLDKIKTVSNLPKINIEVGDIICDDEECWATIYQKDLIQETFRMNKDYCTKTKENEENITECIAWEDYTLDEIKTEIQSYIEKRITDWSDVEDERQKNVKDKKSEKGKIKEKK